MNCRPKIIPLLAILNSCWLLSLFVFCSPALADDWPQFRGPLRDNVSRETGLLKSWPVGGPKRRWISTSLGNGYSSPAVVADRIYILGLRDNTEWLLRLDTKDGRELWATRLGDAYLNEFGDGPRGTPTVNGGLVFALGGKGELLCADAATGKERWRAKFTELGGRIPGWGYSESLLVDDARVLGTPGGEQGAVVAFDLKTGNPSGKARISSTKRNTPP